MKKIKIKLPLLPTTSVGSLPKLASVVKARSMFAKKKISEKYLIEIEKEATEFWIKTQEKIGLDVLVDGEQYRGDMVEFFAQNMEGFKRSGLVRSYGNRYYHKPIIKAKVRWKHPITPEWWRFASLLTQRPVKGMITGPYTIMDWSFNEYYKTREHAALAIAHEIRKEVEVLFKAGANIIQIDEPAVSTRPDELDLVLKTMSILTEGIDCYFITHMCYGAFENIYPQMLRLPVDNIDLETSNSQLDILQKIKKHAFTKDFSFGVVDVHTHKVETKDTIKERIKTALRFVDAKKLWIDPDCGLKTRTVNEAIAKLKSMVGAVKEIHQSIK
jgi:5-methyltetrahydropteroyltriglutamate--homocysteine methyltransferase